MACGNNNNRGGNLGGLKNILDFNVTYTGCETSCGGREIKTGDSLRNVLDALVANCDGGSGPAGSSTNFWFSRNVPTFTVDVKENDFALTGSGAIYEFVDGEWQNTGIQIGGGTGGGGTWGSITGAIADQTDLTEYINLLITEAPVNPDHIGTNLHIGEDDGKLNAGRIAPALDELGLPYTILSFDDYNPLEPIVENSAISLIADNAGLIGSGQTIVKAGGTLFGGDGASLTLNSGVQGGNEMADLIAGDFQLALNANTTRGRKGISMSGSTVRISGGGTPLNVRENDIDFGGFNFTRATGISRVGGNSNGGYGGLEVVATPASNVAEVIIGSRASSGGAYRVGRMKYADGTNPNISEPNHIPNKQYVDTQVSALEATVTAQAATIADLTARIEALENA